MKKYIFITLLPIFIILLTGCGNIKINKGVEEYIGNNYKQVIEELNHLGFSDIETIVVDDLTSFSELSDGTVSEVSIDGDIAFVPKTTFSKEAKVLVTYHIIKKLCSPITLDQISEMDCTGIADAFIDAGFINVQIEEVYDLDPDEITEAFRNEVQINSVTLSTNTKEFPFDADVDVICHYPYEKYAVQLNIDFRGNLIFSKYDVDLLIDGERQDTLEHGKDWSEVINLKEGLHTITFFNSKNASVNGEVVLDVASKIEVEYKIFCYNDKVTIDTVYLDREISLDDNEVKVLGADHYRSRNYKEVEKEMKELGFVNIKTLPIYDIIWGITESESVSDITINGLEDFKRGDIFLNNVEVFITYHMPYEDDPERQVVKNETIDNGSVYSSSYKNNSQDSNTKKEIYDHDAEVLDENDAWRAVERYGERLYSTFDLHYMAGKLEAKQEDDNTWYLKALCDVDTGNGKVENCNCEATVEGTNLDVKVTYFNIY